MSLQDHPVSTIISESNDGCTLMKKSEMFYHVSTGDVILDITCELGYESYNKICGSGRLNGTFNISTTVEIERMFLFFFSPWNRYFNEISNMWQNGYISKKQLKQI